MSVIDQYLSDVTYAVFKPFVQSRSLSAQYIDIGNAICLKAFDGNFSLACYVEKPSSDYTDFETYLMPSANARASQFNSPFASKNFGTKKLYKRETGIQQELVVGENIILFPITYNWIKIVGLEIINGSLLDKVDLLVLDSVAGTYSGVPSSVLNQFGFNVNVAQGFYVEECAYDADLYLGMQIKVLYTSVDAKTIGINFNLNEVK